MSRVLASILSMLVILARLARVDGHSMILCVDFQGIDDQCIDRAPNFVRKTGGTSPINPVPGQNNKPSNGLNTRVRAADGGLCGLMSDSGETGMDALLDGYSLSGTQVSAKRGQKMTLVWPEDNHSPILNKGNSGIDPWWYIYQSDTNNPKADLFDTPYIGKMSYDQGGDGGCKLDQDWKGPTQSWSGWCTGSFTVPTTIPDGTLQSFVASWGLGEKNEYNSCFQLMITGGDAVSSATNSTSTPSPSSIVPQPRPKPTSIDPPPPSSTTLQSSSTPAPDPIRTVSFPPVSSQLGAAASNRHTQSVLLSFVLTLAFLLF